MESENIPSFQDSNSGYIFRTSTAFSEGNRCLLFGSSGHILLLDAASVDVLRHGTIPAHFFRKLMSRNFLSSPEDFESCKRPRKVQPEFFMIDLTTRCNMRCKYCMRNLAEGKSAEEQVLRDICEYITSYCEEERIPNVTIQPWGGEPLLELDSILLMRRLIRPSRTRAHFSIETNGLLLDESTVQTLYEEKIGIGVSIDGTKTAHDAQRVLPDGSGSHDRVKAGIQWARQYYGDKLGSITTVTRLNAPYMEDILTYYASELKLKHIKFNFVHKSGFSAADSLCLPEEEIPAVELRILNKLAALNEGGYSISEENIKVKLQNLLFRREADICHSNGCSGGYKMIVFDMQGNLYPCELTDYPDEGLGSVYDGRKLSEIIQQGISCKSYFLSKRSRECSACPWYVFCQGGCTVRAMSAGEYPPAIDRIECTVNKALYPALVELILTKPQIVNQLLLEEEAINIASLVGETDE